MGRETVRQQQLAEELSEAARRLGLEVRREKLLREIGYRARGGRCCLRNQRLLILDRDMPAADQIELLADTIRELPHEELYLSPAARRLLQRGAEAA
ncbi:MAG TPA: hypothetical protein VFB15_03550 [Candidatus Binataceae bacterium]|nr:hypothetical protein [Candidatus Binataceae bacterium]